MSDVSPTEQVHEQILDHAREARDSWINRAAATASVLAALAAVSGAMSTHYLTVAGRSQIQANDQWSHYQAKSIKGYNNDMQKQLLELQLAAQERTMSPSA